MLVFHVSVRQVTCCKLHHNQLQAAGSIRHNCKLSCRSPLCLTKQATMEDMIGFPGRARPCRDFRWGGGCTRSDCSLIRGGEKPSLLTIIRVLEEAQETLDVCSPTTTCEELSTHARGVTVRAITNDCKKHASTPQAQSFLDAVRFAFTYRSTSIAGGCVCGHTVADQILFVCLFCSRTSPCEVSRSAERRVSPLCCCYGGGTVR